MPLMAPILPCPQWRAGAGGDQRYRLDGRPVHAAVGQLFRPHTTLRSSLRYEARVVHLKRSTGESRWPLYDGVGSARVLVDDSNNHTDTYSLLSFGDEFAAATGSTPNPYRFVGAAGYITDPSGMQQLGARFYP